MPGIVQRLDRRVSTLIVINIFGGYHMLRGQIVVVQNGLIRDVHPAGQPPSVPGLTMKTRRCCRG